MFTDVCTTCNKAVYGILFQCYLDISGFIISIVRTHKSLQTFLSHQLEQKLECQLKKVTERDMKRDELVKDPLKAELSLFGFPFGKLTTGLN